MDSRLRSAPYLQPDAANHSANQETCAEICENLRRAAHEALNSYNILVAEEGLKHSAEAQLRLHRQNLQELTDKYGFTLIRMLSYVGENARTIIKNVPGVDTMSPGLRLVRSLTGTFLYAHKCSMLTRSWCTLHQYHRL